MPHESSEDSSNQPYGSMGHLGCPLDPLGLPGNPPIDPLRPINRSLGLIALLRSPQLPHKSHSPSSLSPPSPRHPCHPRHPPCRDLETLRPLDLETLKNSYQANCNGGIRMDSFPLILMACYTYKHIGKGKDQLDEYLEWFSWEPLWLGFLFTCFWSVSRRVII